MKTRSAIPAILLFYLVVGVLLPSPPYRSSLAAAAGRENPNICINCHSALTDTLPQNHVTLKEADPASCRKCHVAQGPARTFEWLSHFKHYSAAIGDIGCEACHPAVQEEKPASPPKEPGLTTIPPGIARRWTPYFKSWAASGYMDHEHAKGAITCSVCHGVPGAFEVPEMGKCLACHKVYDTKMEKGDTRTPNPHRSHLESPTCALCHKAHEESINYCNTEGCHTYNFKFPYPNTK